MLYTLKLLTQFVTNFPNFLVDVIVQFFLCFSLIQNTSRIMDTKVSASAVTSINGMRVMSMWWVILGHVYAFQLGSSISKYYYFLSLSNILIIKFPNLVDSVMCFVTQLASIRDYSDNSDSFIISGLSLIAGNFVLFFQLLQRFTFEAIGNATFSVDSFFFLRYVVVKVFV